MMRDSGFTTIIFVFWGQFSTWRHPIRLGKLGERDLSLVSHSTFERCFVSSFWWSLVSTKRHLSGAHVGERLQDDASESNGIVGFQAQKLNSETLRSLLPDCNADVSETGVGSQNPEGSSPSALRSLFGGLSHHGSLLGCMHFCAFVILFCTFVSCQDNTLCSSSRKPVD